MGLPRHHADRHGGRQSLPVRRNHAQRREFATCIENIDIGGPALIRAAASDHEYVTVITDPANTKR